MNSRKNLELAWNIIVKECNIIIKEILLNMDRPVLKVVFNNEIYLHIRGMESVIDSPMIGEPINDIPILLKYILD